uniref:Uncharacterized protein n=1 Tax=Helianthus annuus TaxID=4232 RepID=A0A251SB86_HELAN
MSNKVVPTQTKSQVGDVGCQSVRWGWQRRKANSWGVLNSPVVLKSNAYAIAKSGSG